MSQQEKFKKSGYKAIYDIFLDIFFPKRCLQCGKSGTDLCSDCANLIEGLRTPVCFDCGKITQFGQFCADCRRKSKSSLKGIIVSAGYESGPTKEIIHHLKYSGFTELASLLGELIFQRLSKNKPPGDLVIAPAPLHGKREAERGFNQSELIARYVSKRLGIPGGYALSKIKKTESQVKLDKAERIKNLSGAFRCTDKELIFKKTVLLIDDVTTTGTTLEECAKVLKQNGAKEVWGVVVASARY
ncbi:MAG: ComF family protein [Candidatus Woesebacteria bacterium]|nr:ComF family protein [Candidatus Woesebacteria bacterium]